jgi:uncharacterized membrane protein
MTSLRDKVAVPPLRSTTTTRRSTATRLSTTATRRSDWVRAAVTAVESWRARLMDSEPTTLRARRTIAASPDVVYDHWWALAMPAHAPTVDRATGRSPGGPAVPARVPGLVDQEVEVLEDVPGELVTWRAVGAAPALALGRLELRPAPGERGTEARVQVTTTTPVLPLRLLTRSDAREQQLREGLRRFASLVECGTVIEVAGQTHGRRSLPQSVLHKAVTTLMPGGQG